MNLWRSCWCPKAKSGFGKPSTYSLHVMTLFMRDVPWAFHTKLGVDSRSMVPWISNNSLLSTEGIVFSCAAGPCSPRVQGQMWLLQMRPWIWLSWRGPLDINSNGIKNGDFSLQEYLVQWQPHMPDVVGTWKACYWPFYWFWGSNSELWSLAMQSESTQRAITHTKTPTDWKMFFFTSCEIMNPFIYLPT